MTRCTKEKLGDDLREIAMKAAKQGYLFQAKDAFALGYMAATSGLERLQDNEQAVREACKKYDETDDLALHDTIAETLLDLDIIERPL